jgi:kinesin family protein 2/24
MTKLIDEATAFRKTEATEKNAFSSRSHAICRIAVCNTKMPAAPDGLLYLIDLAGSEAARDIASHGAQRLKETREINVSLSVLKDCIRGRAQLDTGTAGKKPYIPFRQSALTKTLKHVFDPLAGRSCKTSVVACVNPSWLDIGPSRNTLRFAEMLRVAIPKAPPALKFDINSPSTWSNKDLKGWISKNVSSTHPTYFQAIVLTKSQSGTPAVNAEKLAPYHTGVQLIKMPMTEFVERCVNGTYGVTQEQAKVLYDKLWRKHIDSQTSSRQEAAPIDAVKLVGYSSAVPAEVAAIPFQQRIRPGMVVRFKTFWEPDTLSMAMVLCPDWAIETDIKDFRGEVVKVGTREGPRKYLCALISPAIMNGVYDLNTWRHAVIAVEDMEKEAILDYDAATRFYHLDV